MYKSDQVINPHHTSLLLLLLSRQEMGLSKEGIISLFGVLVNLPAALLILWKHFVRKRQGGVNEAGTSIKPYD